MHEKTSGWWLGASAGLARNAWRLPGLAAFVGALTVSCPGWAETDAGLRAPAPEPDRAPSARPAESSRLFGGGPYVHFYGSSSLGRGLRLNNPFRLSDELGDSAKSLSLSATYFDLGLGALLGDPYGYQHGLGAHLSVALQGVPQEVLTPSYIGLYPLSLRWAVRGRVGVPIVFEPDATSGFELAAGGVFLATAGLGVTADLVGSVYYGAATLDHSVTWIPIISLQVGVLLDHEVLP